MSFEAPVQRAPVAPTAHSPAPAPRPPCAAPPAAPALNPLLKNPLSPGASAAGAASLMGHYADASAPTSKKSQGGVDAQTAISSGVSAAKTGAESALELSHKSSEAAERAAIRRGDASAVARNADAAASVGKMGKFLNRAGLVGDAAGLATGIANDPKHADEAIAQTAGSMGGAALGEFAAGFTGPLAPVTAPLFGTAGSIAGGYAAGKLYPVAKFLVKDNPIGAALGAPLGTGGLLAGDLGQKGAEFAAPKVAHAAEWGLNTAKSVSTSALHTAGEFASPALSTADHLTTSALHTAGDLSGQVVDAGGIALHDVGSVAKKLDPTGILG